MTRPRHLLPFLAAVLTLLSAAPAAAQGFSQVTISTQKVADGIYMLRGRGGNIGVSAGADGVFLIDDQYAPLHDKITAAVAAISPDPIRFVLNTHWHGDHTGGNELLGKAGTLIVAHDNVRTRMSAAHASTFFNRTIPASPGDALPVVTFNDRVTFHLNGQDIHAFHVAPAHTDGDAVVHFPAANVIHTGDLYFAGGFPFIDLESGGSVRGVIAGADRVLALCDADTKIIPGHGPLSNAAELRDYRVMLAELHASVGALVREGFTLDKVRAAKPAAPFSTFGGGFISEDQIVSMMYHDATKQ